MKSRVREKANGGVVRRNPARAAHQLNDILGNDDQAKLLLTLREMTRDFGGIHHVARQARLNRSQLYRTLSDQGNPAFRTLVAILKTMGLRMAVRPVAPKKAKRRIRPN
jgi:probable addiction module antidote protein